MDATLRAKGTSLPVVTTGNRSYMDPDAVREYLDEAYGIGSWQIFYNCIAPEVYTCDLVVKGVYRTSVVDFNLWPDLKETAVDKFDFLFAQAAHNFGLRSGLTSAESMLKSDAQVIDVTEEIARHDAGKEVPEPEADQPPPADDKPTAPTDEEIGLCIAYQIGVDGEHKSFWDEGRIKGMTNLEIKAKLSDLFSGDGGYSHPYTHCVKGGKEPKLWVGDMVARGTPTLKGVPLVDRTRLIANIPTPEEVKAALEAAFAREDVPPAAPPVATQLSEETIVFRSPAELEGDSYEAAYTNDGQWFLKTGESAWDQVSNPGWVSTLNELKGQSVGEESESSDIASLVAETAADIGDSVSAMEETPVEEAVALNDEVPPSEEETVVAPPQNEDVPPDYDPETDPFVIDTAATPVAESPESADAVFAEAAVQSTEEGIPAPVEAEQPQKLAEVAEFLGKSTASSMDSAICPVCQKVVLPGLAKKCRDAGQVPTHPGCAVLGG